MKSIIILITFVGIVAVVIGYINQIQQCPPPRVEYRYIPRTFEDEQNDPVKVTKLFKDMFESPSVWVQPFRMGYIRPNIYKINRFNISQ
jgi:hypothetical protein